MPMCAMWIHLPTDRLKENYSIDYDMHNISALVGPTCVARQIFQI